MDREFRLKGLRVMGFRDYSFWFGVSGLGFRGLWFLGLRFRVSGLEFGVLGFCVQGLGF